MSFMEYPQSDACRALMPTPENPPPGPPSRPIVCYMPKGHDETDGHAETRRPGRLSRRWHGDARVPVTAVDRPDNGQDGRWCRICRAFGGHYADGHARAGEQQRERVARWLCGHYGTGQWERRTEGAKATWLGSADELLALLGGPQPDEEG